MNIHTDGHAFVIPSSGYELNVAGLDIYESENGNAVYSPPNLKGVSVINAGTLTSHHQLAVSLGGESAFLWNKVSGFLIGGALVGPGGTILNEGWVLQYGQNPDLTPIKLANGKGAVSVVNSGFIEGSTAIASEGLALDLVNTGSIKGGINLSKADDTILNSGSIAGVVKLAGGNDTFDGRGGMQDSVHGGRGKDKLFGGDGADILEGGRGSDVLFGGSGDDMLDGGRGKDRLYGGDGDDILIGSAGKDVLEGGAGADVFVFLDSGKGHADRIVDFTVGEDMIHLDNDHFRKLGPDGALSAEAFQIGRRADDADDRVIYDPKSGMLRYDANGDKAGGVKKIAKLAKGLDLDHGDFLVI